MGVDCLPSAQRCIRVRLSPCEDTAPPHLCVEPVQLALQIVEVVEIFEERGVLGRVILGREERLTAEWQCALTG